MAMGLAGGSGTLGINRLSAMTREHENVCAHLMASFKALEGQLKTLRSEHHALRRCLQRTGVVAETELEKELQLAVDMQGDEVASDGFTPGARSDAPRSVSGSPAVAANAQPSLRDPSPQPPQRRERSPHPIQQRSSSVHALVRGKLVESTSASSLIPSRSAARLRERAQDRLPAGEQVARSLGSPSPILEDLHEVIQRALDPATNPEGQKQAMRAAQNMLRSGTECLGTWSGPSTPLNTVVKGGRVDLLRMLLRARASPSERDGKGVSALHLAAFEGNFEICKVLLGAKADVDAFDRHGQTPLFFAPTKEACRLLLERRADPAVLNRKGQSALHLAGRAGLHEVLAWLGTKVSSSLVELKDAHGSTAKDYAGTSGVPKPEAMEPQAVAGATSAGVLKTGTRPARADATLARGAQGAGRSGTEQLPAVSQLVEGSTASAASLRVSNSDAAPAVGNGFFDDDADNWPIQSADSAEGIIVDGGLAEMGIFEAGAVEVGPLDDKGVYNDAPSSQGVYESELPSEADETQRRQAEAQRRAAEEIARKAKLEEEKAREASERKARAEEAERQARVAESERKARAEAEERAREEAKRKASEEAERKARLEAESRAREDAQRKAKEEAEQKAKEDAEQRAREEAMKKAREEAARRATEAAERKAKEDAERRALEEAEEKRATEEAARRAEEEAQRLARESAELAELTGLANDDDLEDITGLADDAELAEITGVVDDDELGDIVGLAGDDAEDLQEYAGEAGADVGDAETYEEVSAAEEPLRLLEDDLDEVF